MRSPAAILRVALVSLLAAGALLAGTGAAGAAAPTAALIARGSAEQVYAVGLPARATVRLFDRRGRRLAVRRADSQGGVVLRGVRPGAGYRLRVGTRQSAPLTVRGDGAAPPSPRIYGQRIPRSGYGYLTTRDGTQLAVDVHLPTAHAGPYPTLIEYSGYGYADPYDGPQGGIAPIANLLGFAVVDVNMRGTGCSGGSYDYFEPLQSLDGYDVIETVARQPWVLHHRVGMMGVSFGGISQLFVAATRPPHLAAIAPLSVLDDSATTLYPGGVLNTGFGLSWAADRVHDAEPASRTGGQPWALRRIQGGDQTCAANQALHGEAVNLVKQVYANRYYVRAVADPLAPKRFVSRIRVPVFLACQWEDEQTGGHCPELAAHFTGTSRKWFTFTNGNHIDSVDPATLTRWYDFLTLFVGRRAPHLPSAVALFAPLLYNLALGVTGVSLPADPIQAQPNYRAALASFERLPVVRVLFDSGAGGATPGSPVPSSEASFAAFPIPGTLAGSFYLGAGGTLTGMPALPGAGDTFTWNPKARPAVDYSGADGAGGLWAATPRYHWTQGPPGSAVSYLSAPLAAHTVAIGAGSLRVWIRASVPDVDLQATVSEVRPDGREYYVQSGWLRASQRRLTPGSTLLQALPTLRRADARPLPAGQFSPVTIPLYDEGHAYRAGSRIRVTLSAPGGDQPVWAFADTVPRSPATVTVAYSPAMPSVLTLPLVPGVQVAPGLPSCPGLRGEPCRAYRPLANQPGS